MKINKIRGRQVLDSRGNPTLEVDVYTQNFMGSAIVPSGASTGSHEAVELRDKEKAYNGKSVTKAVNNVSKLNAALKNINVEEQSNIDLTLKNKDKTLNKSKLGANTLLGISMACTRAAAMAHNNALHEYLGKLYDSKNKEPYVLPIPFCNIINGGVHSGNELKFQEFMIVPLKAKSFEEATMMVVETYQALKKILMQSFGQESTNLGDEGGFAPMIHSPKEALDLLDVAVRDAGYQGKIFYAIDAAASEFYDKHTERYEIEKSRFMETEELLDYYESLTKKYPVISIEDPFHEDDFKAFAKLTSRLKGKVQVVGDDLTVTNPERIKIAVNEKACNALLLKINQIGTITEALESAKLAKDNGWNIMVSHRSGETEDAYIADLAVALRCGQIKLGAPARGERTAKYNQLLRISDIYKLKLATFKP